MNFKLLSLIGLVAPFVSISPSVYATAPAVHPYWDQGGMAGLNIASLGGVTPVIAFANATGVISGDACSVGLAGSVDAPFNPTNFYALSFGGANGTYVSDCVANSDGTPDSSKEPATAHLALVDADARKVAAKIYTYLSNQDVFTSVPTRLDFDVENSGQTQFIKFVRFRALHYLQVGGISGVPTPISSLKATFTLPVLVYGLVPTAETGQLFLKDANLYLETTFPGDSTPDAGTWFNGINLMTMDYGATFPYSLPANQANKTAGWVTGDPMEKAVLGSVANTYAQITGTGYPAYGPDPSTPSAISPPPCTTTAPIVCGYPTLAALFGSGEDQAKMSITPMIGQNDTPNEEFYLSEMNDLSREWLNASFPHADIRYWSLNRDQSCNLGSTPPFAPFPLGSSSPACAGMLQTDSFTQEAPNSGFYQAATAGTTTLFPHTAGAPLSGTPTIVLNQAMNGTTDTPYYTATITPVASSDGKPGYYMTIVAEPQGIDPKYNTLPVKALLKTISACSYLVAGPPYQNQFTPIQYINNEHSSTTFTVWQPTVLGPNLCPFADYKFGYYTMPYDGDWSTRPLYFNNGASTLTGSPANKLAAGSYNKPVARYNSDPVKTNGLYMVVSAVPDWGSLQATITLSNPSSSTTLPVGSHLFFDRTPIVDQGYNISVTYPPNYTSTLGSGTIVTSPVSTPAQANTILLASIPVLNNAGGNFAFLGAPSPYAAPAGIPLSSAALTGTVGNGDTAAAQVTLSWGHITTSLPAGTGGAGALKFSVSVDGGSPTLIKDNTSNDTNTTVVSPLSFNAVHTYNITPNLPGENLNFSSGGAFTGSFTLPINITPKFTMTVAPASTSGSPQGFGLVTTFTNNSGTDVQFVDGTEVTFVTPLLPTVYGTTQASAHNCGDPMSNSTNGIKSSSSSIGRFNAPNLSASSVYLSGGQYGYCVTTLVYQAPTGVYTIPNGETWTVPVTVTTTVGGNTDEQWSADQSSFRTAMQSSQLALQPYGSDHTSCSFHFYVPNVGTDVINHIPLNTKTAHQPNYCPPVPADTFGVVLIHPTPGATWRLTWPSHASQQCSMPATVGQDANFKSVGDGVATLASDNPFSDTQWYTAVNPGSGSSSACTAADLYNYTTGGGTIPPDSITLSDGTHNYSCTITAEYVTIPEACNDR